MPIPDGNFRILRLAGGGVMMLLLVIGLQAPPATRGQEKRPARRPLTHQDYDSWRSLTGSQISRNGEYVAYSLIPQDGDGEIVVRRLANSLEWRQPRGWRPPAPLPDDPEAAQAAVAALNRATRPVFSADSRYLIFTIEPSRDELQKARREKKRPEEMPKNGLGLLDLATGQLVRVVRVKSFQVPA